MTSQPIRLQVDFNHLARGHRVWLNQHRVTDALFVGQQVIAEDSIEGMEFPATVAIIDPGTGRIYLDVHWEPGGEPRATLFSPHYTNVTGEEADRLEEALNTPPAGGNNPDLWK